MEICTGAVVLRSPHLVRRGFVVVLECEGTIMPPRPLIISFQKVTIKSLAMLLMDGVEARSLLSGQDGVIHLDLADELLGRDG